MRTARSGYSNHAITVTARPDMTRIQRILAFIIVMVLTACTMVNVAGLSGNDRGPRSIITQLDLNTSGKVSAGLKNFGLMGTAYADDDCKDAKECDEKATNKANEFKSSNLEDSGYSNDDDFKRDDSDNVSDNWLSVMNQSANKDSIDDESDNGSKSFVDIFTMVFKRIIPGYYLNPSLDTTADDPMAWQNQECTLPDSPTLKTDNCDVPGIGTEAVQNLVSSIDGHGVQEATRQEAKTPWGLGYSKALLPTDDVPVNLGSAQYKYTAMEALGYNLRWTTYNGEWDHIQVNSGDRLRISMGFGDWAKTAWQAGVDGAKGFVSSFGDTVNDIGNKWKSGDWLGAALETVNPVTWLGTILKGASKAASSALYRLFNNIMNSMEQGSTRPNAWYRPYFMSETMYNVEALTPVEKNAIISIKTANAISEAFKQGSNNLPSDVDEASIRQQYEEPMAPIHTVVNGTPEWQEWTAWKAANREKLDKGVSELGLNLDKYEGEEFQQRTSYDRYRALIEDWRAGVDGKVHSAQSEHVDQLSNVFQKFYMESITKNISAEAQAKPASAWIYCINADGTPDGEPEDADTKQAMNEGKVRKLGKEAFGINGDKDWQCSTSQRPTIIGGLMGSSNRSSTSKDTRRNAYNLGGRVVEGITNMVKIPNAQKINNDANKFLSFGQRVTMLTNTLIGWSFTPILEQFGIKQIIMDWTEKLRDTIYIQFVVMIIAIAGLMIIFRLVRGHPVESFKQIAVVILTFALGIMLLFNTSLMFKLVDDVPTALERAVIGTVFSTSGSDKICTASGTPKGTVSSSAAFSSLFGESHTFNPDSQVRTLQCKVWTVFVLAPWAYGQFNAGWNDLWATGYSQSEGKTGAKEFNIDADTQNLVGDAAVPLGEQTTLHNWALYQIRKTTSGTITTQDLKNPAGTMDRNIYRLVDLQAGPDSASGRDVSHFAAWKLNPGGRFGIGVMSLVMSVIGLIGIGGLCIRKIQYTVSVALMLLISPIILLFGILPGKNELRLKQYGCEVLSLCLKRIATVLVLSISLEVLVEISMSTGDSWFSVMFACIVMCVCIKFFGQEIIDKFLVKVDEKAGKWASANDVINDAMKNNDFVSNLTQSTKQALVMTTGGVIGGVMAGQLTNPNSDRAMRRRFMNRFNGSTAWAKDARNYESLVRKAQATGKGMSALLADRKYDHVRKQVEAKMILENNSRDDAERLLRERGLMDVVYGNAIRRAGGSLSGGQVIKNELGRIYAHSMRTRLHQGRTSPVFEAMKNSRRRMAQEDRADRLSVLAMFNDPAYGPNGYMNYVSRYVFNTASTGGGHFDDNMLTDSQLRMLVMSCTDVTRLRNDISRAISSGDDADWRYVAQDLMAGNASDPNSKLFKQVWGARQEQWDDLSAEEHQKLVDDYNSSAAFKHEIDAEASRSGKSVKDVLNERTRQNVESGQAGFNHMKAQSANAQKISELHQSSDESMDVIFTFDDSYGKAKADESTPEAQRKFREDKKEIRIRTKSMLERKSREHDIVSKLHDEIEDVEWMISAGSPDEAALRRRLQRLNDEMSVHANTERQLKEAIDSEFDTLNNRYNKSATMAADWSSTANDFLTKLKSDPGFAAACASGDPMNYVYTDSTTSKSVKVGDYMNAVANVVATNEAINAIETGNVLKELDSKAAMLGSSNQAEVNKLGTEAEDRARTIDVNTNVMRDKDGNVVLDANGHFRFEQVRSKNPTSRKVKTGRTKVVNGVKEEVTYTEESSMRPSELNPFRTASGAFADADASNRDAYGNSILTHEQNERRQEEFNAVREQYGLDMDSAAIRAFTSSDNIMTERSMYAGDIVASWDTLFKAGDVNTIMGTLTRANNARRPNDKNFEGRKSKNPVNRSHKERQLF